MKQYLIADSGGTKTDWCFVNAAGVKSFFSTESYHPVNWSDEFVQRIAEFWQDRNEMKTAQLFFFGAGCLKVEKSKELESIFRTIGFNSIVVKSDLHAAGLVTLGKDEGAVAIMGTGSVLFNWKNGEVFNIVGGKGHETGDEGSGYYFGKLVYEAYLNDELDENQRSVFLSLNPDELLLHELQGNLKFALAEIASELRDHDGLFATWHQLNFRTFFKTHLQETGIKQISIVGSYAFHKKSLLIAEFEQFGVKIKKIIHKPIVLLVEQIVPFIE